MGLVIPRSALLQHIQRTWLIVLLQFIQICWPFKPTFLVMMFFVGSYQAHWRSEWSSLLASMTVELPHFQKCIQLLGAGLLKKLSTLLNGVLVHTD